MIGFPLTLQYCTRPKPSAAAKTAGRMLASDATFGSGQTERQPRSK